MASSTVNNNDKAIARDCAEKVKSLPASVQFALVTALPNISNGASWGFTTIANAKEHTDVLKSDPNITARKLGNACLIEVNPDYLIKAVSIVNKDLITERDVQNMIKGRTEAEASFEKFLINKGKEGGFEGLVGIYCVNDSTAMTYKSVSYPAFRLPIKSVLELCNIYGYNVKVNGQYITPADAMKSGMALFESMILSPTQTGVFIGLKATKRPEEIKAIKEYRHPKKKK